MTQAQAAVTALRLERADSSGAAWPRRRDRLKRGPKRRGVCRGPGARDDGLLGAESSSRECGRARAPALRERGPSGRPWTTPTSSVTAGTVSAAAQSLTDEVLKTRMLVRNLATMASAALVVARV